MSRLHQRLGSKDMTKSLTLPSSAAALAVLALADVAHADALSTPSMAGPLTANPNPISGEAGPLGKVYVGGVVSGLAWSQDNPVPGDRNAGVDLSNAQLFIQKTDGVLQFYVQPGAYALPAVGTQYWGVDNASRTGSKFYGPVPLAWGKLQMTPEFSLQAGYLPSVVGAESIFTFQNMNINRGLLWSQEPAVSRGVQANWNKGPWAFILSVNDGYFSDRLNWISGSGAYTFSPKDSLTLVGAANLGRTPVSTTATPFLLNNGQIWNLIWTHTEKTWSITPYVQYQATLADPQLGLVHRVSTAGGAVLARWQLTDIFSLVGRGEYIASSGPASLLYGPHSKAWSLTFTPTVQIKRWFARAEVAYVKAEDASPGFAFGQDLNARSQTRGMIETGVLF
jgi:hypothetical protein